MTHQNAAVGGHGVGNLATYSSSNAVHNEVVQLVNHGHANPHVGAVALNDGLWRVTVMMDLTRSWRNTVATGRPGHAGVAVWRATAAAPPFRSIGILDDGTLAPEGVRRDQLRYSATLDVWYFTKAITRDNARRMIARIDQLNGNIRYDEFGGNRYRGSYNCVTFVDDILAAGGCSPGATRPASWLTPWTYSLSFGLTWHSSVIYNASNL